MYCTRAKDFDTPSFRRCSARRVLGLQGLLVRRLRQLALAAGTLAVVADHEAWVPKCLCPQNKQPHCVDKSRHCFEPFSLTATVHNNSSATGMVPRIPEVKLSRSGWREGK